MPYTVINDATGCSGWAVVKEGSKEPLGCHPTKDDAIEQLVALNYAEGFSTWSDNGWTAEPGALVAAAPGELFSATEWELLFDENEIVDAIGDLIMDSATSASLAARSGGFADIDIEAVIVKHVSRLKLLGPEMQGIVREALSVATTTGATVSQMSSWLATESPLSMDSARAFARTELVAATNAGVQAGWSSSGVPLKRWVTMGDDRVRSSHRDVAGQVVPVDMPFTVAGSNAMYPGDPVLPIAQRINCRCHMERIDANGAVRSDRLEQATRDELYLMAQQLKIKGRSKMLKPQLLTRIKEYAAGFGEQRLDEMTRAQLLQRARVAKIVGRHRMRKADLAQALAAKYASIGTRNVAISGQKIGDINRYRLDAGYVSVDELATDVQRVLREMGGSGFTAAGSVWTEEADLSWVNDDSVRAAVYRRFDGALRGHVACVLCGAKLSLDDNVNEPMTLVRVDPAKPWDGRNAIPVCAVDAQYLAPDPKNLLMEALGRME